MHLLHKQNQTQRSKKQKKHITSTKKNNIPVELLYKRTGFRNIKTLLSANQENLWQDVNIIINNDIISDTNHHIATIHKKNRNMSRIKNPNLKPGQILYLDIIKNTSSTSITPSTSFSYFLLAVDAYSCLPKLHDLFGVTTSEIITALKYVQVQLYNLKINIEVHPTDFIQVNFGIGFTLESFKDFA